MIKPVSRNHELPFRFCRWVVIVFFRLFYRWKVEGQSSVPKDGPVILSSNHIHYLDPPLLGASIPTRYVQFMAKEELFRLRPIGKFLRYVGGFPVKRGGNDKSAVKFAISVTQLGGCLSIFPEGHRSKDGRLGKGNSGVAFIARRAGCPIVPVAIIGPYRLYKPLTVRFGEPIFVSPDDTNESLLETLMQRIQVLLDEGHAPSVKRA